jgi:hypothetical protein
MGHDSEQIHEISCPTCQEEFSVALDVDFEKITHRVRCIENCEPSDAEGMIINLDPYTPIPDQYKHADMLFPWLQYAIKDLDLHEVATRIEPLGRIKDGPFIIDINHAIGGQHKILDDWSSLKKGWSLSLKGNNKLSKKFLSEYKNLDQDEYPSLENVLFKFSMYLISPGKRHLFDNAAKFFSNIHRSNPTEVNKFKTYYSNNIKENHFDSYLDIYSQYFRSYHEYSQTLLYVKNNKDVPLTSNLASSSFKNTKLFYGNAFEVLTSGFTVLACLNNIHMGREFDKFDNMTLSKYITINKANRANPFSNTPDLYAFSECINSTLRNASHHGAMKYDSKRNIIKYRSGGTGAEHEISYAQYITACNEIMLSIAALVCLEILMMV